MVCIFSRFFIEVKKRGEFSFLFFLCCSDAVQNRSHRQTHFQELCARKMCVFECFYVFLIANFFPFFPFCSSSSSSFSIQKIRCRFLMKNYAWFEIDFSCNYFVGKIMINKTTTTTPKCLLNFFFISIITLSRKNIQEVEG